MCERLAGVRKRLQYSQQGKLYQKALRNVTSLSKSSREVENLFGVSNEFAESFFIAESYKKKVNFVGESIKEKAFKVVK